MPPRGYCAGKSVAPRSVSLTEHFSLICNDAENNKIQTISRKIVECSLYKFEIHCDLPMIIPHNGNYSYSPVRTYIASLSRNNQIPNYIKAYPKEV